MTEVSYELNLSPDLPSAIQSVALERGEAHEEEDRLKVIDEFRNYIKRNVHLIWLCHLRDASFMSILILKTFLATFFRE